MSSGYVDYFITRAMPPVKPVLAMSILLRDEEDIIEDNILFHLHNGVDVFVISDNASTDSSRDIINKLARNYPIHVIDRPDGKYLQSEWRTDMAQVAYKKFNANWVINNDADEFWLPCNGNLKSYLHYKDTVVSVLRGNMLVAKQDNHYYDSIWRVASPIVYPVDKQEDVTAQMSLLLVSIKGKTIINPRGWFRVKGGSHRASHIYKPLGVRQENDIFIYHFPIRSYKKFVANAQQGWALLSHNPATRMGNHLKRWARMWKEGILREEYERLLFDEEEIQFMEKLGVIIKDSRMKNALLEIKNN